MVPAPPTTIPFAPVTLSLNLVDRLTSSRPHPHCPATVNPPLLCILTAIQSTPSSVSPTAMSRNSTIATARAMPTMTWENP
ncbi:hypothetical protein HPP92_008332 [Vanilla planifolia]|uniref:Uncharacterized protein n=1 Tax=Vanilla planifolia TaxID=51239 RepID=A0A835REI0_VANPL|nr:hypothetical protein HPP92_008531 [Vanilla planifolia]KAG0486237.1 hypothetical protein HPP92_008332 [Vanilla planifolia]